MADPEAGAHADGVGVVDVAGAAGGGAGPAAAAATAPGNCNDQTTGTDAEAEGGVGKEEKGISLQELIYGASSFHAIVAPVSITMILSAVAVLYINTPETKAAGEQALDSTYQVFTISDDQSAATSIGLGLVNSLIIVSVIGAMTFFIVLLYKFRCMKILIGYMVLASTMLLGVLGGQMFIVAINKYDLAIDQLSFYFTMYNFAIVGSIAVFYQKGIPTYINQGYLIATSVIVAWQLSYFNEWMAWALLIMLALYDLFAVLTPCGPLKALVKLMSKDDAPSMPGLLYEAQLPSNVTRPGRQPKKKKSNSSSEQSDSGNEQQNSSQNARQCAVDETARTINETWKDDGPGENAEDGNVAARNGELEMRQQPTSAITVASSSTAPRNIGSSFRDEKGTEDATAFQSLRQMRSDRSAAAAPPALGVRERPVTKLPLALAKIYKLPLASFDSLGESVDRSSPTAYLQQEFSAVELQTNVEAFLPRNGGRIETTRNKKGDLRYEVYGKNGELKRTLLVSEEGKVMEVVASEESPKDSNTIKLGLGDFIFYSVLVSKAAERGFASFTSCFLCILAGLGGTLVLLAVYHKALPALPISIFLAVVAFVLTIYCMEPWIVDLWQMGPFYV
ncbi:hypothetical protein ACHAXT_004323 [Thalassiosira profunda]